MGALAGGSPDSRIGRRIGHLTVIDVVTSGGMGDVLICHDDSGERFVLKQIKEGAPEAARSKFEKETLGHASIAPAPHIVSSRFMLRDNETMYLALEFIEGETLSNYVQRAPRFSIDEVVETLLQVTYGLHSLWHGYNLVHLDLKGENVLRLPDGTMKVGDLGIACVAGAPSSGKGTIANMPPEQFEEGIPAAPTMDVYSLGVLAYWLLCVRKPHSLEGISFAGSPRDLLRGAKAKLPVSPIEIRADTPKNLSEFVVTCLDPDPAKRPRTVDEVETFLAGQYESLGFTIPTVNPFDLWLEAASKDNMGWKQVEEVRRAMRVSPMRRERKYPHLLGHNPDPRDTPQIGEKENRFISKILSTRHPSKTLPPARLSYEESTFAAWALWNTQRYKDAYHYYVHLALLSNNDSLSWWMAAQCQWKSEDTVGAAETIKRVLEINPTNARMWHYRAMLLSEEGRLDEAIKCWEECLRCDYTFMAAWMDRGIALGRKGDAQAASRSLGQASALVPSDDRVRANIKSSLQLLASQYPEHAVSYFLGKPQDSRKAATKAVEFWKLQGPADAKCDCCSCGIDQGEGYAIDVEALVKFKTPEGDLVDTVGIDPWLVCELCFEKHRYPGWSLFGSEAFLQEFMSARHRSLQKSKDEGSSAL